MGSTIVRPGADRLLGLAVPALARRFLSRRTCRNRMVRPLRRRTFDTVEINNSFYRLPKAETFARVAGAGAAAFSAMR